MGKGRLAGLLASLALVAGCSRGSGAPPPVRVDPAHAPLVVVAGPEAAGWVRLLRASGAAVRAGTLTEMLARPAGVIGLGTPLTTGQLARLARWVTAGGLLATSQPDLIAAAGLARGPERDVGGVDERGRAATWDTPVALRPLPSTADAVATAGTDVVAGIYPLGSGRVLASAVDPVAIGFAGHELLPGLARSVVSFTRAPPGPTRTGAEVYLDPGSLTNGIDPAPDALADRLAGARAVFIAGWNGDFRDPSQNYDYAVLVDALHRRGVLAYAWFEPPHISLRMWEDEPQCRERTATGREAIVDWRRLIALEDPACFAKAMKVIDRVMGEARFDGVNVGELYFEALRSPNFEADFTPFHPTALARFGGDPKADAERFSTFRTALITELNGKVLAHLRARPGGDELDLILTVIDDVLDPVLGKGVGSDVRALAKAAKAHGGSLQAEDPFTQWHLGPLRYDTLTAKLAEIAPDSTVDVNVLPRDGARPTAVMTGAEFDLAISSAAQRAGRVGVYAAGTVGLDDLGRLPSAVGGAAEVFDTGVKAPWSVVVRAPSGQPASRLTVDGTAWPAGEGVAVVPRGEHRLEWSGGPRRGPGLIGFNGELLGALKASDDTITIGYTSHGPAYATVDRRPTSPRAVANPDGGFIVRLPAGTERKAVITF